MTDRSFELSAAERRTLRARAHPLHPVVIVGSKGLTDAVVKEVDGALKSHGLIKVKLATADREEREAQLAALSAALAAVPVQHIGKVGVLYRETVDPLDPPNPQPKLRAKRGPAPLTTSAPGPRREVRPGRSAAKCNRPSQRRGGKSDRSAPARKPRSRV